SEKTRAITLPAYAIEELRRLKREQAEELLGLGVRQGGDTLLFARANGEPMPPRSLTHEFAKIAGRVHDVPRVRFHDLRHSHATKLLLAGLHPKGRARTAWPFVDQYHPRLVQPCHGHDAGRCRRKARHRVQICYNRRRRAPEMS